MQDTLSIKQLQILTIIGIYPWEQSIRQPLLLDLHLGFDMRPAAQQQELRRSINYDSVVSTVSDHLSSQRFLLIERVAETTAALLLAQFPLEYVTLSVTKSSALPQADSASVTITRHHKLLTI